MKTLFTCALLAFAAAPALADDAPDFTGRTIEYIVGTKPGGGYDRYARLIAPYLGKHLGGATVVVKNVPAGGGVSAMRTLSRDEGEIDTLVTFNVGMITAQVNGSSTLDQDLRDFNFVGKASSEARFFIASTSSGATTLADLAEEGRTFTCLASSPTSSSFAQTTMLIDGFGLNARILTGFKGAEGEAALAKGEADCVLTSESNVTPMIDAGYALVLGRIGAPEDAGLMDAPDLADLAETDSAKHAVSFVQTMQALGRPTVAAPGIDTQELDALRAAYTAALADPALLAEAAQMGAPIDPANGEATQAMIDHLLSTDPLATN